MWPEQQSIYTITFKWIQNLKKRKFKSWKRSHPPPFFSVLHFRFCLSLYFTYLNALSSGKIEMGDPLLGNHWSSLDPTDSDVLLFRNPKLLVFNCCFQRTHLGIYSDSGHTVMRSTDRRINSKNSPVGLKNAQSVNCLQHKHRDLSPNTRNYIKIIYKKRACF